MDYIRRLTNCFLQDGLSIICMILRNIDDESIDYDTLIFCYLKVRREATRWLTPAHVLTANCSGKGGSLDLIFSTDCQSYVASTLRPSHRRHMLQWAERRASG